MNYHNTHLNVACTCNDHSLVKCTSAWRREQTTSCGVCLFGDMLRASMLSWPESLPGKHLAGSAMAAFAHEHCELLLLCKTV